METLAKNVQQPADIAPQKPVPKSLVGTVLAAFGIIAVAVGLLACLSAMMDVMIETSAGSGGNLVAFAPGVSMLFLGLITLGIAVIVVKVTAIEHVVRTRT